MPFSVVAQSERSFAGAVASLEKSSPASVISAHTGLAKVLMTLETLRIAVDLAG